MVFQTCKLEMEVASVREEGSNREKVSVCGLAVMVRAVHAQLVANQTR